MKEYDSERFCTCPDRGDFRPSLMGLKTHIKNHCGPQFCLSHFGEDSPVCRDGSKSIMKLHTSLSHSVQQHFEQASRRRVCGRFGIVAWSDVLSGSRGRVRSSRQRDRRGSTLLVVMALLGMMTMLGLLYFTFATQESANAINFMEAAKRIDDPGDDIDAIFDESIRQLIQGGREDQKQSSLWRGRHALVTNLYGNDLQPHTGRGINVGKVELTPLASGAVPYYIIVDQDRDGTADMIADNNYNPLEPNDSPAVRANTERDLNTFAQTFGQPDVDYTYPDLNFMALGYKSYFQDAAGTKIEVLKPSFHRPELFHDETTGLPIADWYSKPGYGGRLFRPHPEHRYVPKQGQNIATPVYRFLDPARPADAALIATLPTGCTTGFQFGTEPTVGANGILGEQGVWSLADFAFNSMTGALNAPVPRYEYDVDNDEGGSGTKEGIWMDLDLPVLVRPSDNATYIPQISFTVYELDSLINVNTAGNLSGDTRSASATFGNGGDVSRSSMGLSASEINPGWALDVHPSEVAATTLNNHNQYFGATPVAQQDLANTEIWWLKKGRIEYTTPRQLYAGVYGETNRLWDVLTAAGGGSAISVHRSGTAATANKFPFPGIFDNDDNRDGNEGGPISSMGVAAGQSLSFKHPLALTGRGRFWGASPANNPKILDLHNPIANNPSRWLRYDGMGVGHDGSGNITVGWYTDPTTGLPVLGGALMVNTFVGANFSDSAGFLFDDPDEVTHDPRYLQRPYDEPIETKEMLLLHMSPTDRSNLGMTSRIKDLMPANLTPNGTAQYQLEVGQRLTTDSWDLQNFSLPRDSNRTWEFNVDEDQDGMNEFPPQFSSAAVYSAKDPFRPQLRRLLNVEDGNVSAMPAQRRLNINQLLDVEHAQGTTPPLPSDPTYASYYQNRPLSYRALTAHSTDVNLTTIPDLATSTTLPSYPPSTEGAIEFWARRDRQQMARDIFVMLYTFCHGNNATDVTNPPGMTPHYTTPQLVRMAQFAVNVVDASDRDNVITAFEFDTNLINGWDLDDDSTTVSAAESALPAGERQVVYGVEAQELTFSEVLWLWQAENTTTDHAQTPFDERNGIHHFFQIELRSVSPVDVPLAKSVSTAGSNAGIWRIHRQNSLNNQPLGLTTIPANENVLTFLNGATSVTPGGIYTIANADSDTSTIGFATLYVDYSGGGTDFEIVAPNVTAAAHNPGVTPVPAPVANLDLLHTNHSTRFELANPGAGTGAFLDRTNNPDGAMATPTSPVYLRLERRMNPNLPKLNTPAGANPFVLVDSYHAENDSGGGIHPKELRIDGTITTQPQATQRLSQTGLFTAPAMESREREQPFAGGTDIVSSGANAGGGPSPHKNTIGRNNSTNYPVAGSSGALTNFNLFQPHFDRDFASPIDLLHVFMNGPNALTRSVRPSRGSPYTTRAVTFGQATILQTEDQNGDGMVVGAEDLDGDGLIDSNHFHRFLSMVEVPSRAHRQIGDTLRNSRVPGKIDLNGIRDPRVLAALIDDRQVIRPPERDFTNPGVVDPSEDFNSNNQFDYGLLDATGDANRDWWTQFLIARDGLDLISGLPLPQSGVSRPFRDFGYTQVDTSSSPQTSVEETVLRKLPIGTSGRGLFELVDDTEFDNASRDPFARHRILSKIVNNSTTRGNVFIVYATIGMFGCVELPNGAVRIGGQMDVDGDGNPDTHRAVFIIDRSDAEAAYDKGSRTFDWKKLIKARQRIN